ncbi:hypothetical protein HX92_4124 [Mycobacterium tuberculosis]|nr:hypothetical protein CCDC5079_3609 [Mycobacterium tuberculosis CCDC5079]AEJ52390.1 hypothetical protein CCDC5180_3553 [Mycobacterium tuberculosis CCDC5180]AIB50645.1 hypothetical protein MTBK_41020 [Mycobacterium tuberculosis K]AOZ45294.1 hypothetical protein BTB1458_4298 [Mycobacterium tuberculosis]KQL76974.1 hypothetical protein HX92_4124 [Mycobacterium tuberculosis]
MIGRRRAGRRCRPRRGRPRARCRRLVRGSHRRPPSGSMRPRARGRGRTHARTRARSHGGTARRGGRRPCARDTGRRSRRHRRGGFVRMGRPRLRPPARMLARHTRLLRQRRGFDVRRRLAPWGARCCWTRRTGSGRCNRLGPRRWRRCRSRLRVWSGSWGNGRGRGCRCGRGDRGGDRRDRGWLAWCARFDRGHRGDRLARGHRRDGSAGRWCDRSYRRSRDGCDWGSRGDRGSRRDRGSRGDRGSRRDRGSRCARCARGWHDQGRHVWGWRRLLLKQILECVLRRFPILGFQHPLSGLGDQTDIGPMRRRDQ